MVTTAIMNVEWAGNIAFLANPPACRVYNSANQSIAHNADVVVALNSERYDTDSMHSTVTNNSRITFNTAGLYVVTFSCEWATGTDYTQLTAFARLNGGTAITISDFGNRSGGAFGPYTSFATTYKFVVGDYVEAVVRQVNSASAARNLISSNAFSPEFSATWVGLG